MMPSTSLQGSSQVAFPGSSSTPQVMTRRLRDHTARHTVFVHLDPNCAQKVRSHVAFGGQGDPRNPLLFAFSADRFLSEQLETQWHGLHWVQRHQRLVEHELRIDPQRGQPPTRLHYRIGTSAVLPIKSVFDLFLGTLGCHVGWQLRRRTEGQGGSGGPALYTDEHFRQHETVSVSSFLCATHQDQRDISFDLFIAPEALRPVTYGSMLPWILELAERPQRGGSRRSTTTTTTTTRQQDADYKESKATGGLGAFETFQNARERYLFASSCALDPLASTWEQAHLVPKTLSVHTFNTVIAAVWRFLGHANAHTPLSGEGAAMYRQAKGLMAGVPDAADAQELSSALYSRNLQSTRENNMLPLQPQLHTAFDADEMYVCPLARMPVWVGKGRMPASLILSVARAFDETPLLDHLQDDAQAKAIMPATWANACCTVFSLAADPALQDRLKKLATELIMRRRVGPVREVQLGKHPRDESPDDGDRSGDYQPRARGYPVRPVDTTLSAASAAAGDDQPTAGEAQDMTTSLPLLPGWSSRLPPPPPSSTSTSGAASSAGSTYDPASSMTASTAATSVGSGALTVKRQRVSATAQDHGTSTGKGKAAAAATAEAEAEAEAAAAAADGLVDQGRLSPVVQQSAAGAASRGASPGGERQRGARSRTPSADGDPLNSWWIKTGGSDEERDARLAVVQLETLACCSFKELRDVARLPTEVFSYIRTVVKRLLEKDAGTWQPDTTFGEGEGEVEVFSEDETDAEMQNVRTHKLTPRIRDIFGLDARGKDTRGALLDEESFAALSRCLQRATFFTWWPVALVGEAADLRASEAPVGGSG